MGSIIYETDEGFYHNVHKPNTILFTTIYTMYSLSTRLLNSNYSMPPIITI
jgi:hypothetical protein